MFVGGGLGAGAAQADSGNATGPTQAELVNQANAPISSLFQIRLQDSYAPAFQGQLRGQGNLFSIAIGMPLPQYRLLPFPQLSLLTIPAAVTLPLPFGSFTAFGDVRFVDLAVIDAGHGLLFGVGPTFVFPTATNTTTGQGKWQAGPAAAVAFAPRKWLLGILAQNPISFAGDATRPPANALILQPFITYQLGKGWYLRSRAPDDFRLGDKQATASARCGRGSSLQNWPAIRQLLRRTSLERVGRWAGPTLRNHVWILAAIS